MLEKTDYVLLNALEKWRERLRANEISELAVDEFNGNGLSDYVGGCMLAHNAKQFICVGRSGRGYEKTTSRILFSISVRSSKNAR